MPEGELLTPETCLFCCPETWDVGEAPGAAAVPRADPAAPECRLLDVDVVVESRSLMPYAGAVLVFLGVDEGVVDVVVVCAVEGWFSAPRSPVVFCLVFDPAPTSR